MLLKKIIVISALITAVSANAASTAAYCEAQMPGKVTEFSGWFNVPKNPDENLTSDSMGVMYLWPGLQTSSYEDLIQPCLELDTNWDPLPLKSRTQPWIMVNWLMSYSGSTIGDKVEIPENSKIHFSIHYVDTTQDGHYEYSEHWAAYTQEGKLIPGAEETLQVATRGTEPLTNINILPEIGAPYQNQITKEIDKDSWKYMPKSNWFMWGITVKVDEKEVTPNWQLIGQPSDASKGVVGNCNWNGQGKFKDLHGVSFYFPNVDKTHSEDVFS